MHIDPKIERDGIRWLIGAGSVAVLLVIALYTVDESLSNSTREKDLGDTLRELRGAQIAVGVGNEDPRLPEALVEE